MIIESIKLKTKKSNTEFNVVANGQPFLLHSDIIAKYGLSTNLEVADNIFRECVIESEYLFCLNKATNYINSKLKTTKQLKDYLYLKGFKTQTINRVVEKLKEYKILNDEYFTEVFVKSNQNKFSKKSLENKLATKGVKKEIFSSFIEEVDDKNLCIELSKKFMKNKELTKENFEKLMRHLQYKGFNYDAISSALRALKYDDEF